jgi:hypothetical protein
MAGRVLGWERAGRVLGRQTGEDEVGRVLGWERAVPLVQTTAQHFELCIFLLVSFRM